LIESGKKITELKTKTSDETIEIKKENNRSMTDIWQSFSNANDKRPNIPRLKMMSCLILPTNQ